MKLKNYIIENNKTISTCESCTGGLLGSILTDYPGSSKFYKGGFITYTNEMKSKLLGISLNYINAFSAVSEQVSRKMSLQTNKIFNTDITISTTGYAGPNDGDKNGLVYISVFTRSDSTNRTFQLKFTGDRQTIRKKIIFYIFNNIKF